MRKIFFYVSMAMVTIFTSCGDPCDDRNCMNDSTCVDGDCICLDGYSGIDCEVENRLSFIGVWDGQTMCDNGEPAVDGTVEITADSASADQIVISYNDGTMLNATVTSTNTFTIPEVTEIDPLFGLEITVSGAGMIDNGALIVNTAFTIEDLSTTNCTFTGTM